MKCQKCGFPYFDRKGKCLFCGEEAPIDARSPTWWSSKDRHSSPRTEPVPKESNGNPKIELLVCARCYERSLFFNKVSGTYECVNRKCPSNQKQSGILNDWRKPIPQQAYQCPRCGTPVAFGIRFCGNCGIPLNWQQLQSPPHHKRKAGPRETEQTRPRTEHSYRPAKKPRPRGIRVGHGTRKFFMSIAKLLLCLLVIAGIGIVAWTGYRLFTHQIDSVIGTLVFLTEIGLLIWIMRVLRSSRFRWRKPSFKLVFWPLVAITLVCAFAGIEPMSSAKDRVISFIEQSWETITASSQSPTPAPVQPTPEPVEPKPAPTPAAPSAPTSPPQTVQTEVSYTNEEVEELIYGLINNERQSFGLNPLRKDPLLVSLAKEHSISMVNHSFFSHDRAVDERDFGYGQPTGTIRGENISKTPQRELIPGPYLTLEEVCEWIVSGWMGSTGHRENILESSFTRTGVGVSRSGEYLYITQMFEGGY